MPSVPTEPSAAPSPPHRGRVQHWRGFLLLLAGFACWAVLELALASLGWAGMIPAALLFAAAVITLVMTSGGTAATDRPDEAAATGRSDAR